MRAEETDKAKHLDANELMFSYFEAMGMFVGEDNDEAQQWTLKAGITVLVQFNISRYPDLIEQYGVHKVKIHGTLNKGNAGYLRLHDG